jgi:hypothetical protein
VRAGPDRRGRLGIDQGLGHEAEHHPHHLAGVGGLERSPQVEQGRLIQGHRVSPVLCSLVGSHGASRGGPLTSVTDTATTQDHEPESNHSGGLTPLRAAGETGGL